MYIDDEALVRCYTIGKFSVRLLHIRPVRIGLHLLQRHGLVGAEMLDHVNAA